MIVMMRRSNWRITICQVNRGRSLIAGIFYASSHKPEDITRPVRGYCNDHIGGDALITVVGFPPDVSGYTSAMFEITPWATRIGFVIDQFD